jgi:hypothetical protein
VIGKRQVEQAVVDAARDIAAFYAARVPVPCTASTLLVISAAGDPAAEDWVAVKALAVLAGDSARAAAAITAEADAADLAGAQRTGADACVRYLTSKHQYLSHGP